MTTIKMSKSKNNSILMRSVLLFLIMMISSINVSEITNSDGNMVNIHENTPISASTHDPIIVDGISELEVVDVITGEGTESNPYILENLTFNTETGGKVIELYNMGEAYVTIRNITIQNILTFYWVFTALNSWNLAIEDITVKDCYCPGTGYVMQLANISHSQIKNLSIRNISSSGNLFPITLDSSENVEITDCEIRDLVSGGSTQNYYNTIVDCSIIRVNMYNVSAKTYMGLIYLNNVDDSIFEDSLLVDASTQDSNIYFITLAASQNNRIVNNKMMGNLTTALDDNVYGVYSFGGSIDNFVVNNWFMGADRGIHEVSDNNTYYGLTYFEPLGIQTTVGNFYPEHCFDDNPEFHYFVETPYLLDDTSDTNNSDQFPIHYYALDFDGDGLNNYQETMEYNTDVMKNDTDGDGLSDYDEIFLTKTDPLNSDSDGDGIDDGADDDPLVYNEPAKTTTEEFIEFFEKMVEDPLAMGVFIIAVGIILNLIINSIRSQPKKTKIKKDKSKTKADKKAD